MAVAFQAATASGDMSNLTSKSWSHTCSGADRYLAVIIAGYDGNSNLSGVTVSYNGIALTKLGGNQDTDNNNTVIFGLVNPPAGTFNVQVSNIPANYSQCGGGSISFTGVNQSTPVGTVQNGENTQSVNVPGVTSGDIVLDCFYDGDHDNANPTSGTKRISQDMDAVAYAIASTRTGSGTVSAAYSGVSDPMISAVRIIQSTGAAFGGTPASQRGTISGAITTGIHAVGALQARPVDVSGKLNSIHATGSLAAQSAVISGLFSREGSTDGGLTTQPATIAGSVSVEVAVNGSLAAQSSAILGLLEPAFLHYDAPLTTLLAQISGEVTVVVNKPPPISEVRQQRSGYKRAFKIFVGDK